MPAEEGRALVGWLQEFAQQPRFRYRHRWRAGDAVLWDNRCTQHSATGFDEERYTRLMHRTTLEGEAPIMA
jgi:putative 2-oxoglutarate oxygenase